MKLVTTKSDTDLAKELKEELISGAQAWLDACTKAHRAGFVINAQFAPNYLGFYTIQSLSLAKVY